MYSNKFTLNVVDLNRTDLATEEDKAYQIDQWVKIFKATTWEELRMLSQDNEYVEEMKKNNAKLAGENEILRSTLTDKDAQIAFLEAKLTENNLLH